MAFNPNIPQPGDQLSVSQPQILANFQALTPVIGGIYANQVAHPATAITELALYNKAVAGAQQLVFERPSSGDKFPITAFLAANPGFAFLPSGMLVKWGSVVTGGTGTDTVLYDITYPYINVYNVQLTLFITPPAPVANPWVYVDVTYPTPNIGFRAISNPAIMRFYYYAVGRCASIP